MTNLTTSQNEMQTFEPTADVPVAAANDELREQAISSLKRKRKFAEDAIGYLRSQRRALADLGPH